MAKLRGAIIVVFTAGIEGTGRTEGSTAVDVGLLSTLSAVVALRRMVTVGVDADPVADKNPTAIDTNFAVGAVGVGLTVRIVADGASGPDNHGDGCAQGDGQKPSTNLLHCTHSDSGVSHRSSNGSRQITTVSRA